MFSTNIRVMLVLVYFSATLHAQTTKNNPPGLVVGIMVDGLQQRHLDLLWNVFDTDGFKRIVEKGAVLPQMQYNIVSAGNASDIATIMTGTTPYYHGVTGNKYFNRKTKEVESVLLDIYQSGIGTDLKYSAQNLLSSTFGDELKLAHPNSKYYAIAINPEDAIMMGGHTASSVAWIDETTKKWVTTTYYERGLPSSAYDMNTGEGFSYLANQIWSPLFPIDQYLLPPSDKNSPKGFEYFPIKGYQRYSLKNTPAANSLVTQLALQIMEKEQLGKDSSPDLLMLQFSVRPINEHTPALTSAEKEDMYYRLDKEIGYLLTRIEKEVGIGNALVFLTSNQTNIHSPAELGYNKIPAGYFHADRSMALLNVYLMALYGYEKWVEGYYGKNIFLDRRKLEEKKINLREMQQVVADFMPEFEGIQAAFTASQISNLGGDVTNEMMRIRNSSQKNSAGDITLTLLPGWIEVDDNEKPVGESGAPVSYVPLYMYGWNIAPQKVAGTYQITDIAPTLSTILNIPFTNANIGKTIKEVLEK